MEYTIRPTRLEDMEGFNVLRRMPGVFENTLGLPSERVERNIDGFQAMGPDDHNFVAVLADGTVVVAEYEYDSNDDGEFDSDDTALNNKADGAMGNVYRPYAYEMDGDTYQLSQVTAGGDGSNIGTFKLDGIDIDKDDKRLNGAGKNFFASDVQFVYIDGDKDDLDVTVKTGVQDVTRSGKNFAIISKDNDDNMVVTTVFVNDVAATAGEDVIYVAGTTKASETTYGDDGETTVYGFKVYLNGEKVTIYKENKTDIAAGFYTYTVDSKTGAYTLKSTSDGVAEGSADITYINGSYYVSVDSSEVETYDASDDVVLDTRSDGKVNSLSKLRSELNDGSTVTVGVVYDSDAETVSYIYVKTVTPGA